MLSVAPRTATGPTASYPPYSREGSGFPRVSTRSSRSASFAADAERKHVQYINSEEIKSDSCTQSRFMSEIVRKARPA